jgi:chromosomal replication initiator protein
MQAWKDFLISEEIRLGIKTVKQWLHTLKVIKFDACNLYLEANDAFQALWFEEHIRPRIVKNLLNNNSRPIKVHLSVVNITKKQKQEKQIQLNNKPVISSDPIDPSLTLSSFFSSSSSAMTYKVISEITSPPTTKDSIELNTFNPIFIYGKESTGKTHLLQGAAQAFIEKGYNVLYVKAQRFTEHVVTAIRQGDMLDFRQTYRNLDILIIDDIHLLTGKNATQEEFFHTFNTLHTQKKQIILSSKLPSAHLQGIAERLISRFDWGISLAIETPNINDLKKIIIHKAKSFDINLPDSSVSFLMNTFQNNPTAIYRAIKALIIRSHSNQIEKYDTVNIKNLLSDLIEEEAKPLLSPQTIIEHTAEYFDLKSEEILSKVQTKEYTYARKTSMYLCRKLLKLPFMAIGKIFKRDHSTVMTSIKDIEKMLNQRQKETYNAILNITKNLDK